MKQFNQPLKKPETVQPKATKQAPVDSILNNYKDNFQLKATDEEELLQGKFETAQLKGKDEEELLQGKFEAAQLKGKDEEELLQGKFETAQLKSGEEEELLQKKENNTGLPDNLKSGVENLSGHSMDDVKVHYNSSQPNQLNAHAYAQGTDIHVGPGQEQHLPHEAWHVAQQKQGRVKPTMQMKGKVNVNDDAGLENEADIMGAKALQMHSNGKGNKLSNTSIDNPVVQGVFKVGDEVIVTDENHPDYGNSGTIERQSITNLEKWSVKIHKDNALIRFFPHELGYASEDHQVVETNAVKAEAPERYIYRLHKSKVEGGDWIRLDLKKEEDGSLVDNEGVKYRLLNIKHGDDVPFVSKEAEKDDAQPTGEFVEFLGKYGFKIVGSGTIQDRLHLAIIKIQETGIKDQEALVDHLKIRENGKWYTDHIRQGALNELILTSDSVEAVKRGSGSRSGFDKHGWRNDKAYTFVQLQHDTSYPTKDFIFKETFDNGGKLFQNSHVNARMYYIDEEGKKHRTVGPVSPLYHLSVEKESLKFHFNERTTMKSLVYDLIELHKFYLATKSDILKVKASERGKQVYELRGGDILDLTDPKHLAIFADIAQNHTNSVIQNLKNIHASLQDVPDGNSSPRAPLSPTYYPSVQSPEHI